MEMELSGLIDKIKKEGVEKAEQDADNITHEAKQKAKCIVDDAEKKKAALIKEAETQTENFKKAAEKALQQSARDVLLSLKERTTRFFGRVLKEKIAGQLSSEVLKETILKAVENFQKDTELDIEVMVGEKDRDRLQKHLFSALSKEMKDNIAVKGSSSIKKGFRIGEKGKDSYFDFTDEAIAEAFKRYLNPKLVKLLDADLGLDQNKERKKHDK